MAATVFFLDPVPGVGEIAVLDGQEGRHAATVRRIGVGERLVLADGRGRVADAEVTSVGKDRLELLVSDVQVLEQPKPLVTLVQALPKAERSELAVELATEAGIDAVIPWQSLRCVAKWEGPKLAKGVARWRSAAVSAAKQSRRAFVPEIAELHTRGAVVAVLQESATTPLAGLPLASADEVFLVVGPEGGLDDSEISALSEAGATPVLLGPTVLRTSTAGAVALGAIGVLTDRWGPRPLH